MKHIVITIMILALTLPLGCTATTAKQQTTMSEKASSFGVGGVESRPQ